MAERQLTAQDQQQLLNRVLSSRQFAHAHMLKRVLVFLVECTQRGEAPKEYEIAVEALGRPGNFDPRTDPIVRVSVTSIRNRLAAYFATEGRHEPWQITVPKGQYRVAFVPSENTPEPAAPPNPALARFWAPYFSGRAANIIVYTEPLFFRDHRGHYFRDWYLNDPAAAGKVQHLLDQCGLGPFEPAYHYLSTGEVHCLLSLARMFHEMGVPVETRSCRVTSWNELRQANLILLGSSRTNPFLNALQGEEPYVVTADRIENRSPVPGEQESYTGSRRMDGNLMRHTEYAVVTRRPAMTSGCAITWIASNHGKAIEGAGHFLTLENQVSLLLKSMGVEENNEVPSRFQLLMRVDMMDLNDEVAEAVCLHARILAS